MNVSGEVLQEVLARTGLTLGELLVVCDNLDLQPGQCRLKLKGSSAGHRGLKSIIAHAGTQEFRRIFVGIGRPEKPEDTIEYVLSDAREEACLIDSGVERAAEGALMLLNQDSRKVMNVLNARTTIG